MRALLDIGIESVRTSFSGRTPQELHPKDNEGFVPAEPFFFEAAEKGCGRARTGRERSLPARIALNAQLKTANVTLIEVKKPGGSGFADAFRTGLREFYGISRGSSG
jgi:hypothetical protein